MDLMTSTSRSRPDRATFALLGAVALLLAGVLSASANGQAAVQSTPEVQVVRTGSSTQSVNRAKAPIFAKVDLERSSDDLVSARDQVLDLLDRNPRRLVTIQPRGLALRFGDLPAQTRATLLQRRGPEVESAYNAYVAGRLHELIQAVRSERSGAALAVHGLPFEGGRGNSAEVNRDYAEVLASLDAFVLTGQMVTSRSQDIPSSLRRMYPNALGIADGRALVFAVNGSWRIAIDGSDQPSVEDPTVRASSVPADDSGPSARETVALASPSDRTLPATPSKTDAQGGSQASRSGGDDVASRGSAGRSDGGSRGGGGASGGEIESSDVGEEVGLEAMDIDPGASDQPERELPDSSEPPMASDEGGNGGGSGGSAVEVPFDTGEPAGGIDPEQSGDASGDPPGDGQEDSWNPEDEIDEPSDESENGEADEPQDDADDSPADGGENGSGGGEDGDGDPAGEQGDSSDDQVVFDVIRPGSGWSGETSPLARAGNPGDSGYDSMAIAHWDTVQFQEVDGSMVVGVVPIHMSGIDFVEIAANGGPWTRIHEESFNADSGIRSYAALLDLEGISPGTKIELRARVQPMVGRTRVLQGGLADTVFKRAAYSLTLYSKFDSSERFVVRLAEDGDDATGDGSADAPYRTFYGALRSLHDAGIESPGAVDIELEAGEYTWGTPASVNSNKVANVGRAWVTVQPAPGVDRDEVEINKSFNVDGGSSQLKCGHLRLRNVNITSTPDFHWKLYNEIIHDSNAAFWLEGVRTDNTDRFSLRAGSPFGNTYYFSAITESDVLNYRNAARNVDLVRNSNIISSSEDQFTNSRFVVGCTSVDNWRGQTDWHNDFIQLYSGKGDMDNLIFKDLVAIDQNATFLRLQQVQDRSLEEGEPGYLATMKNIAFVNILWVAGDLQASNSNTDSAALERRHLVFDHVTVLGTAMNVAQPMGEELPLGMNDIVVRNSVFTKLGLQQSDVDSGRAIAESNHYYTGDSRFHFGTDYTLGDFIFANGWTDRGMGITHTFDGFRPSPISPLADRVQRTHVRDGSGRERDLSTAIGALEAAP